MKFDIPIVLIIYNRPDETHLILNQIEKIKPKTMYVFSDGSKDEADLSKVIETRKIVDNLKWDCNIIKNYSEINLGCSQRIISGLNSVFDEVDQAIILEDDCLPDLTFFKYCQDLLAYYQEDEKVMHISGYNPLQNCSVNESYFFSKFSLPWGWATWKRAWKKFNPELNTWQLIKKTAFQNISQEHFKVWTDMFEHIRLNRTTWDIPWNVDIWGENGICIVSKVSLIQNIGIGKHATFTKNFDPEFKKIYAQSMDFPLIHPLIKLTPFDKFIEEKIISMVKLNIN